VILLGAVAGVVTAVLAATKPRKRPLAPPGQPPAAPVKSMSTFARVALVVVSAFATAAAVGGVLSATDLSPGRDDESDVEAEVRAGLKDKGFNDAQATCVTDRLTRRYGSVDEGYEASKDDSRVLLSAVLACGQGLADSGQTDVFADCLVDGLAVRTGRENLGAEDFTNLDNPEDRRHVAEASMVCAGVDSNQASCVIDHLVERFPDVFERDGISDEALSYFQGEAQTGCL
jgi:hypothetical protein